MKMMIQDVVKKRLIIASIALLLCIPIQSIGEETQKDKPTQQKSIGIFKALKSADCYFIVVDVNGKDETYSISPKSKSYNIVKKQSLKGKRIKVTWEEDHDDLACEEKSVLKIEPL